MAGAAAVYACASAQLLALAAAQQLLGTPAALLLLPAAAPLLLLAAGCARAPAFRAVTLVVLGRAADLATTYLALSLPGTVELNPLWRALPPPVMIPLQVAVGAALGALAAVCLLWDPPVGRALRLALRAAGAAAVAASWHAPLHNAAVILTALSAQR